MLSKGEVVVSGDEGLAAAPSWGSGGFAVQKFGSISLAHVGLTAAALKFTMGKFGPGGMLTLNGVTILDMPELGALTGTITGAEGLPVLDPPDLQLTSFFQAHFVVVSGPCTAAEGGRCVARWPDGYLPNEDCEITVAGSGAGVLGPCPVFSINSAADPLTLPDGNDGNQYYDRDCPVGAALAVGHTLTWHSNSEW